MKQTMQLLGGVVLALICAAHGMANGIPVGDPESVGMSSERLERIRQAMAKHIDAGNIQGAVTVVARHGQVVHFEAHGFMDANRSRPM